VGEPVSAEAATSERDVLLATKLNVPRLRPDLVPRPRLAQRLDQDRGRGLALICAPAGSLIEIGALAEALILGCPQGYVRVFADEGPPMAALLTRLIAAQRTSRELEVLGMLAAGKSNQAIASQLFVTLDTVKKHVSHLLGKLGAENRTEAVTRARELGLIP
jgi:LuxR family maltose regulon positive regulatory protein